MRGGDYLFLPSASSVNWGSGGAGEGGWVGAEGDGGGARLPSASSVN